MKDGYYHTNLILKKVEVVFEPAGFDYICYLRAAINKY
jgi:hypothetical protein